MVWQVAGEMAGEVARSDHQWNVISCFFVYLFIYLLLFTIAIIIYHLNYLFCSFMFIPPFCDLPLSLLSLRGGKLLLRTREPSPAAGMRAWPDDAPAHKPKEKEKDKEDDKVGVPVTKPRHRNRDVKPLEAFKVERSKTVCDAALEAFKLLAWA